MKPMLLLGCLAIVLAGGAARADVVPEPPSSCPPGGEPSTCHGGPYCFPAPCAVDTDCDAGETCDDLVLCIEPIDCTGMPIPDAAPALSQNVVGTCGDGAQCAAPGVCTNVKACVGSSGPGGSTGGDSGDDGGCSCVAAGASAAPAAAGLGALVAGLAAALARRQRARSRQRRM